MAQNGGSEEGSSHENPQTSLATKHQDCDSGQDTLCVAKELESSRDKRVTEVPREDVAFEEESSSDLESPGREQGK